MRHLPSLRGPNVARPPSNPGGAWTQSRSDVANTSMLTLALRLMFSPLLAAMGFITAATLYEQLVQNTHALLSITPDQPIAVLLASLTAMIKLSDVSVTTVGYAPLTAGQVMEYRMYLAPNYLDEHAKFPRYIEALQSGRYRVMHSTSKSLWTQIHDIRSAIGGIDSAIDWWDLVSTTMDVQGTILFTGTCTDATLLSMSFSELSTAVAADPDTGALSKAAASRLLPLSAIPKRQQWTAFMYKQYTTDPQQLPSFNLRRAADEWLAGLGSKDLADTCVLRQHPSYVWFDFGYWRPLDFFPSEPYRTRYTNASVGDWVIECTAKDVVFEADNMRWYGNMGSRSATTFYHMAVQLRTTRRVFFTQRMLLAMVNITNGYEAPIRQLIGVPDGGEITPLPSTVYVVSTDTLTDNIRNVWLVLVLLALIFLRSSIIGFRTLLHFLFESPLIVLVNVVYNLVTVSTGIEQAMMLADAPVPRSLWRIVYMAIALRPYMTPAMIVSKARRVSGIDLKIFLARSFLVFMLMVMILVMGIDFTGLLLQTISTQLNLKRDPPMQLLLDSLTAMVALPTVSTTDTGYAPLPDDEVMEYRMYLGPKYMDEHRLFPDYINALTRRQYRVLTGMTTTLWNHTHDIRSEMRGIDCSIDWWDLVSATMDVQGTVLYTGASTEVATLSMNYSTLVDHLKLDPSNPVLDDKAINKLLPWTSIAKRQQRTAIMYKQYATDPQQLPSFNLRVAVDEWLDGVGGRDFVQTSNNNATCVLREKPSYVWFIYGYWRPRDFYPGVNYVNRYTNISVGDWVVECDTPNITFEANNMRWYAGMKHRQASVFYQLAAQFRSTRRVFFPQNLLLNMTSAVNGYEVPIRKLVSMPSDGGITPLPSSIYLVETEGLGNTVQSVWLVLALLLLLHVRATSLGLRTLFHFLLESPLSIVLDVICAIATMSTGLERAMILSNLAIGASLKRTGYVAAALRPFTVPAMILSKALIGVYYGTKHVTPYITIRESVVMLIIQVIVIHYTSSTVVAAGLRAHTSVDDVITFMWQFHGTMLAVTASFIYMQFVLGRELRGLWRGRIGPIVDGAEDKETQSTQKAEASQQARRRAPRSAYDEYVGTRFFAFGVCFLPQVDIKGRLCRVLDGAPLWMEAFFNFNWNGPDRYNRLLRTARVIYVSCVGQFVVSDVELDIKHRKDSGAVYIG